MAAEREEIVIELLRRVHSRFDRLEGDLTDMKVRLSSIETGQAIIKQELAQQSMQIAALNVRMDRFDERVARIERRLDLADA